MPDMETLLPIDKIRAIRNRKKTIKTSFIVDIKDKQKLWIFLNDTERIRRNLGMSAQNPKFIPRPNGGSTVKIKFKKMMMDMEFYDLPPYWDGSVFQSEEIHVKGPLKYLSNRMAIKEAKEGKIQVFLSISYSASFFIRMILYHIMLKPSLIKLKKYILNHVKIINNISVNHFFFENDLQTHERSDKVFGKIMRKMKDHPEKEITKALASFIATVGEENLFRVRPYEIAAFYNLDKIKVLEYFLLANNKGVFEMSWDLLCPNCQGRRDNVSSLSEIENNAHCDMCNIAYDIDYASNIELSFRPHPSIRKISNERFCYGGYVNTPHILVQTMLDPASIQKPFIKEINISLKEGDYFLKAERFQTKMNLTVEKGSNKELVIDLIEPDFQRSVTVDENFKLTLKNTESYWHRVGITYKSQNPFIATADVIMSLSSFRKLYGTEPLSPGINLSVSNVALVFTDVGGSTELYQKVGDSKAFSFIKNHFDIIDEILQKHNGSLVKTIGDATMSCFYNLKDAFNFAVEVRQKIVKYFSNKGLSIKIGVNEGPCIAMNLNDKLDYFGSMVNVAARLEQNSDKNKISLLEEVIHKNELNDVVQKHDISTKKTNFKGIGETTVYSI